LPTEAQWEYACRSGNTTWWFFGDNQPELEQYAWYGVNSGATTHPVGQKLSNGFGLFDIYGNVIEWCHDWYAKDYYSTSPVDDPTGLADEVQRLDRGGNWTSAPWTCRTAVRDTVAPRGHSHILGFRLAAKPRLPQEQGLPNARLESR